MAGNVEPLDGNYKPILSAVSPGFGLIVPQAGSTVATDSSSGQSYAPLVIQQSATSTNATLQSAAAANGNGTALAVLGNASIIFTVTQTGFTGTVNFECSEDNSNWDPLQVQQEGTNLITTAVTGSTTTSTHLYEGSVAGLQSVRARVSGFSAGTITVTAHAIASTDAPRVINAVNTDGQRATYRASTTGLAAVTGCTDLFTLTGSASKTIRITRVEFGGTVATAAMYLDVLAVIRSGANLTGTSTTPTVVPLDSNDPAGTAVVRAYTANPGTLGTLVGAVRSDKVLLPLTGTPVLPDRLVWNFGNRPAKTCVLRGATQVFAINLNGIAIANATLIDVAIEWTEDVN